MHLRAIAIAAATAIACLTAGCAPAPVILDEPFMGGANPATVFCLDQGHQHEMDHEAGIGTCILSDGTRVEEWDYYRANA